MFSTQKLDSFLSMIVSDGTTPSVCASVVDHQKVLYRKVFGYASILPSKEKADLDTLYDLASITKVLQTTMLACRLMERGKISLETKISDVLEFSGNYSEVTVFQLMTHTGGFVPFMDLRKLAGSPQAALKFILSNKPIYEPGKGQAYSCFGFIVLGYMLSKVSGMSLEEAAKKYVYEPLGMKRTMNNPWAKGERNIASTEKDEETGLIIKGEVHDENARFLGGVSGNAGVFSCIRDMEKFLKMLLNKGRLEDGSAFLSEKTVSSFNADLTPEFPDSRGIGFYVGLHGYPPIHMGRGFVGYGHTGFTGPSIWIVPELDRASCMLANRVHPSRDETRLIQRRRDFYDLVFS